MPTVTSVLFFITNLFRVTADSCLRHLVLLQDCELIRKSVQDWPEAGSSWKKLCCGLVSLSGLRLQEALALLI